MKPLSPEQVAEALRGLPQWTGSVKGLERKLEFEDFRGAMQFMQACVEDIDRLNHHPTWSNTFNRVAIHLDTFDKDHVVTGMDVKLAQAIDRIVAARGAEFGLVDLA